MGYAGRMLAKHDPWLIFGLWVALVGLLIFQVINVLKREQTISLIIDSITNLVSSITYSLFPAAKIIEYFNVNPG